MSYSGTKGRVVADIQAVSNAAYLTIQPTSTNDIIIQQLTYSGAVEIYHYDGSNSILIESDPSAGSQANMMFPISNTQYLRVKNVSGSSQTLGFSGYFTN